MTPNPKSEIMAVVAVAMVALAAMSVYAYEGTLDTLLAPLTRLDIAGAYVHNHIAIDAIVFFALFLSIFHVAVPPLFKGRAGTAVSVALAAAFTLSLSVAESRVGFTLQDFGPVAAALVVLVVAVAIYRLVHVLGMGTSGAGALAFVVAYIGARAAAPRLFLYAAENPWLAWLHLAAVVALVVFLGRALVGAVHAKDIVLGHAADALGRPLRAMRQRMVSPEEAQQLEKERGKAEVYLTRVVDRPWKESTEIVSDLAVIREAIERFGESPTARHLIVEKVQSISAREHVLAERLKQIQDTNERLHAFDLRLLSRIRSAYEKLPESERKQVRTLFAREVEKLAIEEELETLEKSFREYDAKFKDALAHIVAALRLVDLEGAVKWIDRALEHEGGAGRLMAKIRQMEDQLKTLTRMPLSELKAEMAEQSLLFT